MQYIEAASLGIAYFLYIIFFQNCIYIKNNSLSSCRLYRETFFANWTSSSVFFKARDISLKKKLFKFFQNYEVEPHYKTVCFVQFSQIVTSQWYSKVYKQTHALVAYLLHSYLLSLSCLSITWCWKKKTWVTSFLEVLVKVWLSLWSHTITCWVLTKSKDNVLNR